jgi:hypothetical protein
MKDEEKRLLLAVAQAVLNDDPYVAAGIRARIERLMGVVETPMDKGGERRED